MQRQKSRSFKISYTLPEWKSFLSLFYSCIAVHFISFLFSFFSVHRINPTFSKLHSYVWQSYKWKKIFLPLKLVRILRKDIVPNITRIRVHRMHEHSKASFMECYDTEISHRDSFHGLRTIYHTSHNIAISFSLALASFLRISWKSSHTSHIVIHTRSYATIERHSIT